MPLLPSMVPLSLDALALLDALPVGVLHATDERIDYVNREIVRMYGREAGEILGQSILDNISPEARDAAAERLRAQRSGERIVYHRQIELRRPDGTRIRVDAEAYRVGEREVLATMRDVSEEIHDRSLLTRLSTLSAEVQRCRTADHVLRVASEGLNALGLHVAIGRCEGERTTYQHVAMAGAFGPALLEALSRPLVGASFPTRELALFAEVERERKVLYRDDAVPYLLQVAVRLRPGIDEVALRRALEEHGVRRCVIGPLMVGGALWGFLGVASAAFSSADVVALSLFASKVSLALESTAALARLEQRNRELAAAQQVTAAGSEPGLEKVLDQLVRIAEASLCSEAVAVYLLDAKGEVLSHTASNDRARLACERCPRLELKDLPKSSEFTGGLKPLHFGLEELPGPLGAPLVDARVQQIAIVPLQIKGKPAGCLLLGREAQTFSAEDLHSAQFVANQMAVQLENARLFADASRRLRLLEVLFDVSQMGKGALDVLTLVDRVLQHALVALSVEGAGLYVVEGDRLILAGLRGNVPHPKENIDSLPLDASTMPGRAVLERRTQTMMAPTGQMFGAFVPLISNERPQGVFVVARRPGLSFDEEESRLLEALAAQVGSALEQVRAFEDERRRLEDFKLFVEVGRVVTASLDLEQILGASAVSLARIAAAKDCTIFLLDGSRQVLRGAATSALPQAQRVHELRIPLDGPNAVVQAVLGGRAVRVPDLQAAGAQGVRMEPFDLKSLFALPLTVREQVIGAVVLTDDRVREWTDAQVERAGAVAGQIAVAVANARLYEDLKKSYQDLARAQAELVKRERLAALGELSAVVAHEVRNPLGVIFNSLRSLTRVLKPQGDAKMLLDIVGEEADRLNRIVGDLLDFARPSEPALQPEPLGAMLESAVEAARGAAAASGVKLVLQEAGSLPKAAVDARMLRQALLNLLMNAVQAMPRGGTVTLSASEQRPPSGPARIHIDVEDTGPGVPPELGERVFEPFFTTKAAGTGLGLAVVKRIAEAHGGEVRLQSVSGKGAKFTLVLPLG